MAIFKSRNTKGSSAELSHAKASDNPYLHAKREWNEVMGSAIAQKHTWQMVAFFALGLAGLFGCALVYQASQARVQPFVVQVDKLGQAVAVGPADRAAKIDERIIRAQLAEAITNCRSISTDPIVQKRWLDRCYALASPATFSFLNDYFKANDPFEVAKNSVVSVEITSAMPISDKTWQIQWSETKRGKDGLMGPVTRWQAIATTNVTTPTTPAMIMANPTGLVIDTLTWTQQL